MTANGICSAAFCESAALRGYPLRLTTFARFPLLSLRDIFPRPGEVFPLKGELFCTAGSFLVMPNTLATRLTACALSVTCGDTLPLLSLRDIFPRSGGSRPSRGRL